jgi:hypothetical protein
MHQNNPATSSWAQVFWSAIIAVIGFGFAIYRYLQFSGAVSSMRLSRLERPIYRLAGKWGLISVFILMGIVGIYYTFKYYKLLKK